MLVTPHILCRIRLALALSPGTSFIGISSTQSLTVLQKSFNCWSLLSDCYLPLNWWKKSYPCPTLCHPAQAIVQFPWNSGISLSVLSLAVFSSFLLLQMHRPPHAATQWLLKCISLRYCCQKRFLMEVTHLYHTPLPSADLTDGFCFPLSVCSSSSYLQSSYGSLMVLPGPSSSLSPSDRLCYSTNSDFFRSYHTYRA